MSVSLDFSRTSLYVVDTIEMSRFAMLFAVGSK